MGVSKKQQRECKSTEKQRMKSVKKKHVGCSAPLARSHDMDISAQMPARFEYCTQFCLAFFCAPAHPSSHTHTIFYAYLSTPRIPKPTTGLGFTTGSGRLDVSVMAAPP